MDEYLIIAILAIACAFVFGLVVSATVVFFRQRGEGKNKQTEAQATIAKWLTERERQNGEVARLRADVAAVKATKQDGAKDIPRIWERLRELEALVKDLQPKPRKRSRREDDYDEDEEEDYQPRRDPRINGKYARR